MKNSKERKHRGVLAGSGDDREETVVEVHAGNCDDYKGCNSDCRWVSRDKAEWHMGAWREIVSSPR